MPLDGEELDELLSGFVDGALSETERRLVEESAQADVRLQQRILLLRRQSSEVNELGKLVVDRSRRQFSRKPGLTLAETVIAQARKEAAKQGLPNSHYVYGHVASPSPVVTTSQPAANEQHQRVRKPRLLLAGCLATAAAVFLAVFLARPADDFSNSSNSASRTVQPLLHTAESSKPNQAEPAFDVIESVKSETPAASQLVGQFDKLSYVLVVDLQITANALRNNVLEDILSKAGIPRIEPVVADQAILKKLDQSQMIVNPRGIDKQSTYITVIRAEMEEIEAALQAIWKDTDQFPNFGVNLAVDAKTGLVQDVLKGTGGRFSVNDSFAVPVNADTSALGSAAASPFPGVPSHVNYVSSSIRSKGWPSYQFGSDASSGSTTTILLVTHVVE